MNYTKFVLCYPPVLTVFNAGVQVDFLTKAELKRVAPSLLPAYRSTYVFYAPVENVFTNCEPNDAVFDALLNQIQVLKTRQDDVTYGLSGQELVNAQKQKAEQIIRATFLRESTQSVVTPYGVFNGGIDSARDIKDAVALADALGETTTVITDVNNVGHELTFSQTLEVAGLIGLVWRNAFYKKQQALVANGEN